MSGLFYDPYWGDENVLFQCWASFPDDQGPAADRPWNVLCVYTKPQDVRDNNKTVDIRFYSSLERDVNNGGILSNNDLKFVQRFLEAWYTNYVDGFSAFLPINFEFLFGSFHLSLLPAAEWAFQMSTSEHCQPWDKYLISSENLPPLKASPPQGYEVDTIYPQHIPTLLSSSPFARSGKYLETRITSSSALYSSPSRDKPPIAFCINAPDGSLSMLWVDRGYRACGLGTYVARYRLAGANGMLRHISPSKDRPAPPSGARDVPWAAWRNSIKCGEIEWSHADIAEDNIASRKICKALGAVQGWKTVWIRSELRRN
jgi:hypothetical protein